MTITIANDHIENIAHADAFPLECAHNLRIAIKDISYRPGCTGSDEKHTKSLFELEKNFGEEWVPATLRFELP